MDTKSIVWTPTKIDQATYCLLQWYLINIEKVKARTTGSMALGIFMHKRMENFFKKDGKPIRKSAEAFANSCAGWWTRYVINSGKIRGEQIHWKDKNEPWILREIIKKMCGAIYERRIQEPLPLYTEFSIPEFEFEGRRFRGKIDEIRFGKISENKEGPIIRDYKTGRRKPGKMKLNYDPQFTLYLLAISCLCYNDKKFAESIGISEMDSIESPLDFFDKIGLEYYLMREDKLYQLKRNKAIYEDFCRMIEGLEEEIENDNFSPQRGRLCDYCSVNEECDARTGKTIIRVKKPVQLRIFDRVPWQRKRPKEKRNNFKQGRLFKKRKSVTN